MPCVDLHPVRSAFVELLKQWPEPIRMLVINRNGLVQFVAVAVHFPLILTVSLDEKRLQVVPFYSLWRRSGRLRHIFSRAAARRHLATSSWFPPIRVSGTFQPRYSAGRV